MGYTHYWTISLGDDEETWGRALEAGIKIALASPVPLRREYDEDAPPALGDGIRFNGVGEDGHETFVIPANTVDGSAPRYPGQRTPGWDFCKTAQKPYDLIVVAVLATLTHYAPDSFSCSSDGWPTDWVDGVRFAREVTGAPIQIPEGVLSDEGTTDSYKDRQHVDREAAEKDLTRG